MRGRGRALALTAIVLAVAGAGFVLSDAPARVLVRDDAPTRADAVVVMAGDPDYERTATAARLVRAGQAPLMVLTGGERGPGDSASSLRRRALELGVPADRIRVETASHSTREAVLAVEPILREAHVRTVILVTSPYHERRAAAAARRAWTGIEVRSRPASPSSWRPERWWRDPRSRRIVVTEYLKLAYYAARGWL